MASVRSESEFPNLAGMTAVVTGASSGIGFETARVIAVRGAHVVLAVRSTERGQAAVSSILSANPRASIEVVALDLADLATVHRFADALRARLDALDLLINNAGVASTSLQRTTDGFELVFGTNHLGHFALTGLLLQALLASPIGRVVTVTSLAHARGHVDFDNLDGSKGYSPSTSYSQSKLANVLFAYELQRRLSAAGAGQVSVACHPGWAATNMTIGSTEQNQRPQDRLLRALAKRFAPTATQGARPIIFAATSPDVHGGDFIGPRGPFSVWGGPARVRSSDLTHNHDLARHLWEVSESMTGVHYTFAAAGSLHATQPTNT